MKPNKALIVILSTVVLDAVGIGLVMPVLPSLLRDLVHSNDVTTHYGVLLSLYALMQFACAPGLGALSDRFGRRPVLLVSLAGATVDYAIMATAPFLCVLYIGRIVAGITGATGAVAGAYIADITDGAERARHFGFMSACFGIGMVAGPVLVARAQEAGRSVSDYLRARGIGQRVHSIADQQTINELRRLGGLLKKVHTDSLGAYSDDTGRGTAEHRQRY